MFVVEFVEMPRHTIIRADKSIPPRDPILLTMFLRLETFELKTPLQEIRIKKQGPGADHYTYHVKMADGRVWDQELIIAEGAEPLMRFDVPDYFTRAEFVVHVAFREEWILLTQRYRLTRMDIDWT